MPRVGEALGILFYVYAEDRNPPHIHAICGDDQAEIEIATGSVIVGSLPGAKLRQGPGMARTKPSHRRLLPGQG
jgi:hypothetical protein